MEAENIQEGRLTDGETTIQIGATVGQPVLASQTNKVRAVLARPTSFPDVPNPPAPEDTRGEEFRAPEMPGPITYFRVTIGKNGIPIFEQLGSTAREEVDITIRGLLSQMTIPCQQVQRCGRPGTRLIIKAVDHQTFEKVGIMRCGTGTYVALEPPLVGQVFQSMRHLASALGFSRPSVISSAFTAARRAGLDRVIIRGVTIMEEYADYQGAVAGVEDVVD